MKAEKFIALPCVNAVTRYPFTAMVRPSAVVLVAPFGGDPAAQMHSEDLPRSEVSFGHGCVLCVRTVDEVVHMLENLLDLDTIVKRAMTARERVKPKDKRKRFSPKGKVWRRV